MKKSLTQRRQGAKSIALWQECLRASVRPRKIIGIGLFLTVLMLVTGLSAHEQPATGSLRDVHSAMKQAHDRLASGDTGKATQTHQAHAAQLLAALIEAAKSREASSQASSGSGQSQPQSQSSQSASQSQTQSTPGDQPGTGSKQDEPAAAARMHRLAPQSPWSKLRDRQRDPVYNSIKERFPARYQQLLEQYYQSFQDAQRR